MNRIVTALMFLMLVAAFVPYHADADSVPKAKYSRQAVSAGDAFEELAVNSNYSKFITAVRLAGLEDELDWNDPYTVFIPTNTAIDRLPAGTWDDLMLPGNRDRLRAVLQYHFTPGRYTVADFNNMYTTDTVFGQPLSVNWVNNTPVFANRARIVTPDITFGPGYVHEIDTVLWPSNISDVIAYDDDFDRFTTAIETAGLMDRFANEGPITVFVPNASAFDEWTDEELAVLFEPESRNELRSIVNYHVVPGIYTADDLRDRDYIATIDGHDIDLVVNNDTIMVDNARILRTIPTYNGVVHVVDQVILPDTAVAGSFMQRYSYDDDDYMFMDDYDYGGRCYYNYSWDHDDHHHGRWSSYNGSWQGDLYPTPKWWKHWGYQD